MNAYPPGQVCGFEFVTPDPSSVEKFYGRLLGWAFEPIPHTPELHIFAPAASTPMGAIVENHRGGEYLRVAIASADVDDDCGRLRMRGATFVSAPTENSFELADPRGNLFTLVSTTTGEENTSPDTIADYRPVRGSMAWFELGTTDPDATRRFYGAGFDWRFEFDANAGGRQYYNIFTGPRWPTGGMYDLGPGGREYFVPCFLVGDVPEVSAIAERYGAVIEFGPDGTPDGLEYVRIIDPNGIRFELFSVPGL